MFLLTRPLSGSLSMAKVFTSCKIPFHIEPLLSITLRELPSLEGYKTIVITSHYALACLKSLPRDTYVYCVGASLEQQIRQLGISNVIQKPSVEMLLKELKKDSPDFVGSILYVSGNVITQDIESVLAPLGYSVTRQVVYLTSPAASFSRKTLEYLNAHSINSVCFFSKKTAEIFMQLMDQHGLGAHYSYLRAFSFSAAISQSLQKVSWKEVLTSVNPSMNSFWNLIENHVG